MAVLKIARMGHPVLRQVAALVADPKSKQIQRLVEDMTETLEDSGGIGLAAPQVHVPLRVVIYAIPEERMAAESEGEGGVPFTVLINPRIDPLGEEKDFGPEACLSVPGLMGVVPRWRNVLLRALDGDGVPCERQVSGFHARVLQHECDHLDGILYPQRMADLTTLSFVEEARRFSAAVVDD